MAARLRHSPHLVRLALGSALVFSLLVAWGSGVNHDYSSYTQHWQLVIEAVNPWAREHDGRPIDFNAYGPGNLVLAPAYGLHPIFPKLLLTAASFLIGFLLIDEAARHRDASLTARQMPSLVFALCPLVIIYVYGFGSNDILPALAVILAFRFRAQRQFGLLGLVLGFGALIKFFPLLFVPFFAQEAGRFRLRSFITASLAFLVGMGAAYFAWGEAVFAPFAYAANRGPKMLSILRFLDPASDRLGGEALVDMAIAYNMIIVTLVASLVALYIVMARLDWRVGAMFGILITLAVYKVGHAHFYLVWMAAYAWLGTQPEPHIRALYTRAFAPVAIFLSVFSVILLSSGVISGGWYLQGPWYVVRQYVSLTFAVVLAWSFWSARAEILKPPRSGFSLCW